MTTAVAIDLIDSFALNPRVDVGDVSELAATIRVYGIVTPLTLAPNGDGRYTVLSGHRRLAAAKVAGLREVPALVRDGRVGDHTVVALIANTHHVPLNPIEEGNAYRALMEEHGWTQYELAAHVGRSQGHVSKRLKILDLPLSVRAKIAAGALHPDVALYGKRPQKSSVVEAIRNVPTDGATDRGPNVEEARLRALIQRLATRGHGNGLTLTDEECSAVVSLIKRAAATLREAA